MQPRTLDQIIAELNPTYEPQVQSLRQRQSLIPQQIAAEEKGLQAKQEQAFGDILDGARRRGLGFSGIPLGEQAKYTSTEFLPALARLRQSGQEQAMSLEDAILGIYERRNSMANQLYQTERDRAEQIRQFNENLAFQRQQFEAQQREAEANRRAASALANPSIGRTAGASTQADKFANVDKNRATDAVLGFLKSNNINTIRNSINAITASANRGNVYDQFKLQLIDYYRKNSGYGNLINQALNTKSNSRSTSIPVGRNNPTVVARF